ncbi:hypothetical protein AQJ64_36615 [Streptomyces griseoruber]|uniref:Uncharacterized protein n=2 Tax=Streptomyces griseoruber TaxID=1943 RepID=A0A101SLU8_9ACTN|nr:hypothetical protein AQJ64_36615 [Streptomyces griseoruber]
MHEQQPGHAQQVVRHRQPRREQVVVPFSYDTAESTDAWIQHLAGIEDQVRLFRAEAGMLTEGVMPEYLFRRTRGIVGLLERLIEDGCTQAIDSGDERLTTELLDEIDINLGNPAGRLPDAGEVPDVPKPPRRRSRSPSANVRVTTSSTTVACPARPPAESKGTPDDAP